MKDQNSSGEHRTGTPVLAFKIIAILLCLVVGETIGLVWFFYRDVSGRGKNNFIFKLSEDDNIVKKAYPQVDFQQIYPDLKPQEIDLLQRECFSVRYVYSPFVEFSPVPQKKQFVTITGDGYRKGWRDQPWPPAVKDFVVFVFGGSTTFSYGLPDHQTLPVMIEQELSKALPAVKNIHCYNFGRGYFFSTQERILFESLLLQGIVPNVAIFVDGLNDFHYAQGNPELTGTLYKFTAPDIPQQVSPINNEHDAEAAVAKIISRYRYNTKMITALTEAYGITPVFIGQPVPFLDFPVNRMTFPFPYAFPDHTLGEWGYDRFRGAALAGEFGKNFIWCGNAFSQANAIMYSDNIHYSIGGAKLLAQEIVRNVVAKGIITSESGDRRTKK